MDEEKTMAGVYEALFICRALTYKRPGLKDKPLTEKDNRQLILEEYSFLKKPVTIIDNTILSATIK